MPPSEPLTDHLPRLSNGADIVRIARISRAAERWGDRFISRIFTAEEQEYCESRANRWQSYSARFAAKEAFFKAARTVELAWLDVEVRVAEDGAPVLNLHGRAAEAVRGADCSLSLSHDGEYALAFVTVLRSDGDRT